MLRRNALVVAGGFGIDSNVYVVGQPQGAETTFARTSDGLGQAGCYSALAAAALEVPTRAIAALGADRLGTWVREELEAAGVRVTELRDPLGTHRSINLVSPDGSRRNYFDPRGVSRTVVDEAACRAALRGARVLHCHLDDWCRHLLPIAREEGVLVSCDLQDLRGIDDEYRAGFIDAAEFIVMSASNLRDPAGVALELAARRPGRTVLVGAGPDGCLLAHDGGLMRFEAADLPGRPVVDTNGAGDNLAVGFLVAHYYDGLSVPEAARHAQLGARWICSQYGDAKAPLRRSQLQELVLGGA